MIDNTDTQKEKNVIVHEEGSSKFYLPIPDSNCVPSKSMSVFYNKRMEVNRDISNLAINAYNELYKKKELIIVDSMAATGISSIRMLKECKNVKKIYVNDINPAAVELIKRNFELNNLKNADIFIEISKKDASLLFSELSQLKHNEKPNVISIDPFGTPNLYIDPAFKAIINKGGLMCITATDTPVLFGVKIDACLRKYMAKPLNNEFHKETGARILMYFIQRIANINKVGILPLLTMYSNHFVRIFGLTFKSKKDISESIKNFGYFIYCKHCGYRSWCENMILNIPECCPSCEKREKLEFAGPLWLGELHKRDYLERLIELNVKSSYKNRNRLNTILSIALEEINMPKSYYNLHYLSKELKLKNVPKIDVVIEKLRNKGYTASRTHFDFKSIKTDMNTNELKQMLVSLN